MPKMGKKPISFTCKHQNHWGMQINDIGIRPSDMLYPRICPNWTVLEDALQPAKQQEAWDDYTTWTGSILKHADSWYMFYTGTKRTDKGNIQRIGLATSDDLLHWEKYLYNPVISIDPKWYELLDLEVWYEEVWRDPWVIKLEGKFHAFITARSKKGAADGRGVIGHAESDDLLHWNAKEPITEPGEFGYMEVPQLIHENGHWYLFFSVIHEKYSKERLNRKGVKKKSGTHYLVAENPFGPYRFIQEDFLCGDLGGSFYSGKVLKDSKGNWAFMACHQFDPSGKFIGMISDPMPLRFQADGKVRLKK